jgi:UDP:flavonoid glycosyltransferase YjiC (YdhE family)
LSTPSKINNSDAKLLKVLVAPLDWGLGHATRCIPVIKELLNQRCVVIIAASGAQKALLQEEFPSLSFVEISGYHIKYDKNRALSIFRLITSIPKILIRVKRENKWLRRFARDERPDLVLSDNRYGLYLPGVCCVFMTHQLLIRAPFGGSFGRVAERFLQQLNYFFIQRFSRCWVPDIPGDNSLSGKLSHTRNMPSIPTTYIGLLSRFGAAATSVAGTVDLLVLLSGPEPQRTILEKMILDQAKGSDYRIVLVRGLPGGGKPLSAPAGMHVHDHLPAAALEPLIRQSSLVLARSGYSTVMDLVRLGKKAIYIPTPGQTEQEYLGTYLSEHGWGLCIQQGSFSLPAALAAAQAFTFRSMEKQQDNLLTEAVGELLNQLR